MIREAMKVALTVYGLAYLLISQHRLVLYAKGPLQKDRSPTARWGSCSCSLISSIF